MNVLAGSVGAIPVYADKCLFLPLLLAGTAGRAVLPAQQLQLAPTHTYAHANEPSYLVLSSLISQRAY
jgi:hypothetical protein